MGGDNNNSVVTTIPKGLFRDISIPLTISSKNTDKYNNGIGYTVAAQGTYKDGAIVLNYVSVTGWTSLILEVYGLY